LVPTAIHFPSSFSYGFSENTLTQPSASLLATLLTEAKLTLGFCKEVRFVKGSQIQIPAAIVVTAAYETKI
jgi:hypothetical protein